MKKTLFMLFCLLCSIGAMAQKKTITGVVTDATGEAVIGASIVETGTTNGTVTDLDGNFTLSVAMMAVSEYHLSVIRHKL